MEKDFYELVVEGHFSVAKGFIHGLMEGSKISGTVLFSRENNIRRETLVEKVLEWIHLREDLIHVLCEESLLSLIRQGLEKKGAMLKLKLCSVKPIQKASFDFHYVAYSRKHGEEIKEIFVHLPAPLRFVGAYQPKEEIHPEGKGLEEFAPLHEYKVQGEGAIEGPLEVLLTFYRQVTGNELIKADLIKLHFAS